MTRKKTQEQIIQEFKEIHGDKYSYSDFVYVNAITKSSVTCHKHGNWLVSANSHKGGHGCPRCAAELRAQKEHLTQEEVIRRIKESHGDTYDLSGVEYIPQNLSHQRISVPCRLHGSFNMSVFDLCRGRGCPSCGKENMKLKQRDTLETWKDKCSSKHDGFYSYHACTEYTNSSTRMSIFCPVHGYFEMTARDHTSGRKCSACSTHGYDKTTPSTLYILESSVYTKLGITNLRVQDRLWRINSTVVDRFFVYKEFHFDKGGDAFRVEQDLLKELRNSYDQPKEKFDGSTECFIDLPPTLLQQLIENKKEKLSEMISKSRNSEPEDCDMCSS